MNVLSNTEEHWRRFPELQRLFTNASLPNGLCHHSGLRSPYTTVIDDIHDIVSIAATVGNGAELIRIASERVATEEYAEHIARMEALLRELRDLADDLGGLAQNFIRVRSEELARHRAALFRAIDQAQKSKLSP